MEQTNTTKRARSARAKLERRDAILDTALALWQPQTFASFAMADLALQCGLAKGTLYLYFATKEQLFLGLLERELTLWFGELDAGLAPHASRSITQVADLLTSTLTARPALIRLLPITASILEHNIPAEAALSYKTLLLAHAGHSGKLLEGCLEFLESGDGIWLLLQVYALTVGYGQMADPSPVVAAILEQPAMAALRVDFKAAFRHTITTLLQGMQSERTQQ
jgi:AcrR family transcriptional regulator